MNLSSLSSSLFFVLAFGARHALSGGGWLNDAASNTNSNYCCQQSGATDAECHLGGCQFGTSQLAMFYSVANCSQCVTDSFRNSTRTPALRTTCAFCSVSGDHCVQVNTTSDSVGCRQTDAALPLASFQVVDASTDEPSDRPFCCYYRPANQTVITNYTSYQVQSDAGKCPFADSGYALVAFVEHHFDFPCPAKPPCESDCHGHGLCAVSQCVCDQSYFGPSCQSLCDSSNCKMGTCYNRAHPQQGDLSDAQPFDDEPAFDGVVPSPACHCTNKYVTGRMCDQCVASHIGPDCQTLCIGAPCNGSYMTGNCTAGACECEHGYGHDPVSNACVCLPSLCTNGRCTKNNTCECAGHWNGTGCDECACENGGQCSKLGKCLCVNNHGGDLCERCEPPYFDIDANCSVFCLDHTTINVTYNGSDTVYPPSMCQHQGLCNSTTGNCTCPPHSSGEWCESCDDGYFGLACGTFCDANDTCSGLGVCNNGTGLCDCFKSGFGGNCTACKENYYPKGECTTLCDQATTCNYHGTCTDQGVCKCYNDVIYASPDCSVKLWVIIVPCAVTVVLFGAFFGFIWWRKKKQVDEFGEPLLGGGGW